MSRHDEISCTISADSTVVYHRQFAIGGQFWSQNTLSEVIQIEQRSKSFKCYYSAPPNNNSARRKQIVSEAQCNVELNAKLHTQSTTNFEFIREITCRRSINRKSELSRFYVLFVWWNNPHHWATVHPCQMDTFNQICSCPTALEICTIRSQQIFFACTLHSMWLTLKIIILSLTQNRK